MQSAERRAQSGKNIRERKIFFAMLYALSAMR